MDHVALIGTHPDRTEANVHVAALGIGVGDHSAYLAPRTETWEAPNSESVTAFGGRPTVTTE